MISALHTLFLKYWFWWELKWRWNPFFPVTFLNDISSKFEAFSFDNSLTMAWHVDIKRYEKHVLNKPNVTISVKYEPITISCGKKSIVLKSLFFFPGNALNILCVPLFSLLLCHRITYVYIGKSNIVVGCVCLSILTKSRKKVPFFVRRPKGTTIRNISCIFSWS